MNNAGIMPIAPLALLKVNEWDRMIDLNIKGVLYGIAAALPQMQKQKSGHIIIASVFGIKVFAPGGTVYCATKAAVRSLTEGLRVEVHADKVRTTIMDPGEVESESEEGTTDEASSKAVNELYKTLAIPAESIARAIAYAIEQPDDVDINEIVVRPTGSGFLAIKPHCVSTSEMLSRFGCTTGVTPDSEERRLLKGVARRTSWSRCSQYRIRPP